MNNKRPRRAAFATLGCRLNQFETDALVGRFAESGWEIVPFDREADLYVINTCTITGKGEQKSRHIVNKARRRNPEALIAVTGCSVEYDADRYRALDGVDLIVDNAHKSALPELVAVQLEEIPGGTEQEDRFAFHTGRHSLHTRAMIKIQDGCNNFCSFCIVPHVRGRAVSLSAAEVRAELERTIALGYKEIVLTGVNISRWQEGERDFADLVEQLLAVPGDFRLHLPSVEPDPAVERLLPLFSHPKLVRHLHICIQSGSETVLKRMRRRHTAAELLTLTGRLRAIDPLFNISADIITGFPGESDEEFAQTIALLQKLHLSHIHTFKYSPRKGTAAAAMEDQIPEKIKKARSQAVRRLAAASRLHCYKEAVAAEQQMLVEQINAGSGAATGYSEYYYYCELPPGQTATNRFVTVKPVSVGVDPVRLICTPVQRDSEVRRA